MNSCVLAELGLEMEGSALPPPQLGSIAAAPFAGPIRRSELAPVNEPDLSSLPPTTECQFVRDFELVAGSQNLFPILLEVSSTHIYVCSKDCFIGFLKQEPTNYEKINLPEMPTCFKVHHDLIFFGLQSGAIIVYNVATKSTLTKCEEFDFAVMQIEVVDGTTFLAMDSQANLKLLAISTKMFMDKVIKVSVAVTGLVEQFRLKKRDKIKSLVKNLPFRKDPAPRQQKQLPAGESNQTSEPALTKPSPASKFCLYAPNSGTNYPLIYFHKSALTCLTMSPTHSRLHENTIVEQVEGSVGILQLGEGGFAKSNQRHLVLVVSVGCVVQYYRGIEVEGNIEFIKITQVQHERVLLDGRFVSNNLIVFLSEEGVEISNIGTSIAMVQRINFEKFSYVDFFNQEEQFQFDKRILYANILKPNVKAPANTGQQDSRDQLCGWYCLEGKRLLAGEILGWSEYLDRLAQEHQWEKCMRCALMIYQERITLLGNIPESMELRRRAMRQTFEKITLTYLSYELKSTAELQSARAGIVRTAIDFMVRTQSFEYLFGTIYQAACAYGLAGEFLYHLHDYITAGAIKQMGEQVLAKVIDYYTTNKSDDVVNKMQQKECNSSEQSNKLKRQYLETLIMNFDYSRMEKSLLLSICLNYELYRSLIHICRQQKDYVTPIIKLCGLRIAKQAQLQGVLGKHPQQAGQQVVSLVSSLQVQLQRLTDITYWYLQQCLQGRMTEFDNPKQYLEMLQQLIRFMFIPSSLLMLLQASPAKCFLVLSMVFGATVMQYVLENEKEFAVGVRVGNTSRPQPSMDIIEHELAIAGLRYGAISHLAAGSHMPMLAEGKSVCSVFSSYEQLRGGEPDQLRFGQFAIYNNMLANVIYTVVEHYRQNMQKGSDQRGWLVVPTSPTAQKQGAPKHTNVLDEASTNLFELHKFLTYLILSNSFPFRLGWRVLAFEFLIAYPSAFSPAQSPAQLEAHRTNWMLVRLVDSIIRQVGIMVQKWGRENEQQVSQSLGKRVLGYMLNFMRHRQGENKDLCLPTKCYMLGMLEQSDQIVAALLQSQSSEMRMKVFAYAEKAVQQKFRFDGSLDIEGQASMVPVKTSDPLLRTFIDNTQTLLSISETRTLATFQLLTRCLIMTNSTSIAEIQQLCSKFSGNPDLELRFLELTLGIYNSLLTGKHPLKVSPATISKNIEVLAIRHLQTVLQHRQEQLQDYVLRVDYPLEEAFRVCEQCQNKTAMAYILIKSGRNLEGVVLISDLMVSNLREVLRDVARNIENPNLEQEVARMTEQLGKILETCANEYQLDQTKGEEMWEKISEKLFKELNIRAVDSIPKPKVRQILQMYIDMIITAMFSQVGPEFFVQKFSQNQRMSGFPGRYYLKAHSLVFSRLGFHFEINHLAMELLRAHEMRVYKKLLQINQKGVSLGPGSSTCNQCQADFAVVQEGQAQFNERTVLAYTCGHSFHVSCLKAPSSKGQELTGEDEIARPQTTCKAGTFCPVCKNDWDQVVYGDLRSQPQVYGVPARDRKKSALIEQRMKLADFDACGYFQIRGEELLSQEGDVCSR